MFSINVSFRVDDSKVVEAMRKLSRRKKCSAFIQKAILAFLKTEEGQDAYKCMTGEE